jgi:alpha-glucosidase (family GH31 glycosyl hydrolase)
MMNKCDTTNIHTKIQFTDFNRNSQNEMVLCLFYRKYLLVIHLELKLERVGKNNLIEAETIRNLLFSIKFAKNKAKIEISDLDQKLNEFRIPKGLYDFEDFELEDDGRIEYLEQSNIGIHIVNHPFSFYLFRKETGERLFDTTHSNESSNQSHYLYYAKNYIQISTALPKDHYTYGLGERFGSLRLKKGKYILWAADPTNGKPVDSESNNNFYSSVPSYITVNPKSLNSYGALMLNSSPMEVMIEEDYLTFKMTSGYIELYVFNGPRPKEIIMQMQQTIGMPILPEFSAINWQANLITSMPNRDIVSLNHLFSKDNNYKLPIVDVWVDYDIPIEESLYKFKDLQDEIASLKQTNHRILNYSRSPLSKNYENFEVASNKTVCIQNDNKEILFGKTSYGEVCFLDYMSPNALSFVKNYKLFYDEHNKIASELILLMNEPSHDCDGECNSTVPKKTSDMKLPYVPGGINLQKGTLPLKSRQYADDDNGNNNVLLNTHNLYSLQEAKTYYHAISDYGVSRPLLFSRSFFPGTQQYAGKWLGYIDQSWDGLRLGMLQTINFNV